MNGIKLPPLKIGDINVRLPIIQGGMGVGISLSSLSSAVANEGGIGVISTAGIGMEENNWETDFQASNIIALRKEIRKARELTKGILGVNIMVALSNFKDMVRVSIEEGIDIIFAGAGLPLSLPNFIGSGTKTELSPIVSSGRAADIICRAWDRRNKRIPDAIVVEGPLAGGHLGFSFDQLTDGSEHVLEDLVQDTIKAVRPFESKYKKKIPVIAAGGIFTGRDIVKFLKLGAAGVQLGTRFVATYECDASDRFKDVYIEAEEDDIVLIKSPVGLPGRAIENEFLEKVNKGEKVKFKCSYHCLKTCQPKNSPYCIARALTNAKKGDFKYGFAFAGQNAYRVNEIMSVKELVSRLVSEAEQAT